MITHTHVYFLYINMLKKFISFAKQIFVRVYSPDSSSSSSSRNHTVDIDPQWRNMDCCM